MLKIRKLQNKNSIVKEIGILTKQGFNNRLKTLIGEQQIQGFELERKKVTSLGSSLEMQGCRKLSVKL